MASQFDSKVLLQARWIVAIVVAIILVLMFVRFGYWQLSRLDERRALNITVEERSRDQSRPLSDILGEYDGDIEAMLHRSATVEGVYRTEDEFFSIGRTIGTEKGALVATPLDLADGSVLIVMRGLVRTGSDGQPEDGYAPPPGLVELEGRIDDGEDPTHIVEPIPEDGHLVSLSRFDLIYIDRWIEGDVLPITLILTDQTPPDPYTTPIRIPPFPLTEGSHLGYAVQWFGFALVVGVGVAILIYRSGLRPSSPEDEQDRASET